MKKISLILCFIVSAYSLHAHPMRPVPWITDSANTFLESYLQKHPNAKILEFGSGSSTLWFAKRTKNLTSVEHHPQWFHDVSDMLAQDAKSYPVNLILRDRPYYTICSELENNSFDLVLVDGRNRKGCIVRAIPLLKKGGIMMLDNAERTYYKAALDLLKGWNCTKSTQVNPDQTGFTYPNWQTHWYIKP